MFFLIQLLGWYYIEKLNDGQKGWVPISATREIESNHIRARNFKQRHAFLKLLTSMDSFDTTTSANDLLNNNNASHAQLSHAHTSAAPSSGQPPQHQQTNRYSYYNEWKKTLHSYYYSSILWYFFLYFWIYFFASILKMPTTTMKINLLFNRIWIVTPVHIKMYFQFASNNQAVPDLILTTHILIILDAIDWFFSMILFFPLKGIFAKA